MDEYNLAEAFLDPTEVQKHVVDIEGFQKIPLAELAGFGGIIAELIPQFRTITETTSIPMEGLFRAINPKTGEVMPDLMYKSKQVADAFVGSLKHANGEFDQAAFVKVPGVKEVTKSVAAINPATLMIAAGIMAMSKKLDTIQEGQKSIMGFLEKDKESKLKGDLTFLLDVYKKYRLNWSNSTFKSTQYNKTQDIEQEAEHNIEFYRSMLSGELKKKKFLVSKLDVKKNMQKLIENFSNYRLAIYIYAFASYLEIILLENFNADFLKSLSEKIKDESFKYVELYTIAYTKLENMAATSLESGAIKGAAVLDFIGNDYKRSVQIAFALGSMAENFVVEKNLVAALVADNFTRIGLLDYGVEIHLDDLSKKEILAYIDEVNFNTKTYLQQDYNNFKKYISASRYPAHVDYLNNDYAPDLIKFMQSRISGRKNASYLGFLQAIGEEDLPVFSERQEAFIKYVSEMLPIVRPYEYLIIQAIIFHAGDCTLDDAQRHVQVNEPRYNQAAFDHALHYMLASGFFTLTEGKISFADIALGVEFDEYVRDLLEYGLGKYDVDFHDTAAEEVFHLWAKYRKEQVQQLLLNNPKDIMLGTKIYDGIVYAYVTVIKSSSTADNLKYADGYIDADTFQWETVANVSERELNALKNSKGIHIFVRKVDNEDGIQLPFTYIGMGKMEYIEGSKKANGAHLFRIPMEATAPEDIYFDFKLPE